jgi:hypothetical protein
MPISDWSAATLCTDADILGYESTWLDWTNDTARWRAKAKAEIEIRLRHAMRDRELETDADDVLDLIANPEIFVRPACFFALALCAQNNTVQKDDTWAFKSAHYEKQADEAMGLSMEMIEFDQDESGTIDDSEKYQVGTGVTFTRGGGIFPPASEESV